MSINFNRAADYYDATRGYPPDVAEAVGQAVASAAAAIHSTRFLEIGAGTGRIGLPLVALGHDYTGIDISTAMLDRFKVKLAELESRTGEHTRAVLLEADAHDLPFPNQTFDVVVATHVFHLVADPQRVWQETRRVLKPGGVLLICSDRGHDSGRLTISRRWREIVAEEYQEISSSSDDAVLRLLRDDRLRDPLTSIEELRTVHWQETSTPAEELEGIQRKLWSNTWRLPDAVFDRCFARLQQWTVKTLGGALDAPEVLGSDFVIQRVRFG